MGLPFFFGLCADFAVPLAPLAKPTAACKMPLSSHRFFFKIHPFPNP